MTETTEQRPRRRKVQPYNGIRTKTQPLCPEFWIPNARGTPARENNAVSLGSAIGARGLLPQLYSRLCKPLTCSDATRPGAHDLLRGLLRLTECSHHVGSSGVLASEYD